MDIVYPIKKTIKNEDLRYSLRSLCNIEHNKVFIIGELPDWVSEEVYYIPVQQNLDRYEATTNNIKIACQCKELSNNFILMNDDFFIINKITEADLNLNRGPLKDTVDFYHENHSPLTRYDKLVENAMNMLKLQGFNNPISFELHAPMIINKNNFLTILDKINNESLHCCKRSVYGNYFIKDSKTIKDVKVLSYISLNDILQNNPNTISCSESVWPKIKDFIHSKFPDKSKYEK